MKCSLVCPQVDQVVGQEGDTAAHVVLADGATVKARKGVVVAVQGPEAARMLGSVLDSKPSKNAPGVGTCCLYFKAPKAARDENILYLNGNGKGIVNNCCFPSTVAPTYAPAGQALVSVSTVGTYDELSDSDLSNKVKLSSAKYRFACCIGLLLSSASHAL